MIRPLKWLNEVRDEMRYLSSMQRAESYFSSQRDAILNIKNTIGYKEIKKYWQRVREASVVRLSQVESQNVADYKKAQAMVQIAQEFLDFLENVENTPDLED